MTGIRFDPAFRALASERLGRFERQALDVGDLRHAAVACLLVAAADGTAGFVITRRSSRMADHPGQWALPGGRVEVGEDAVSAALRETSEEIGLTLDGSAVLGVLDDYPTRSGHMITPVVVWAGDEPRFVLDEREVARVYVEPFSMLDDAELPWEIAIPESDRPVIRLPMGPDEVVHAPTAAVLWQCHQVVIAGLDTRVAHYDQPVFAWR